MYNWTVLHSRYWMGHDPRFDIPTSRVANKNNSLYKLAYFKVTKHLHLPFNIATGVANRNRGAPFHSMLAL
jgi:hypothetical protein